MGVQSQTQESEDLTLSHTITTTDMGKFSLTNLIMCVSKYQKLNSEDYIRMGLCLPDCQDCRATGQGHYTHLKSDHTVKNNLLLNNQMGEDKLQSHHQQAPLKKIVNNLANTGTVVCDNNNNNTCNPCKESQLSAQLTSLKKSPSSCTSSHCTKPRTGVVNLAFVDHLTEQSSCYQPHLARDLAVKLLADSPEGSFMVTEAGFRIKGFSKVFSSLSGLVVHHSVMQESLPCRLLLDTDSQDSDQDKDSDFADLDEDPEYPGLLSKLREQLSSD